MKKNKRNFGEAYESKTKTSEIKEIPAAKIGPPCKCKDKCYDKLGQEAIKAIHEEYYKLPSYDFKTAYIQSKVDHGPTKNQEKLGDDNTSRVKGRSICYVSYKGNKVRICKVAFMHIHDIKKEKVIIMHLLLQL